MKNRIIEIGSKLYNFLILFMPNSYIYARNKLNFWQKLLFIIRYLFGKKAHNKLSILYNETKNEIMLSRRDGIKYNLKVLIDKYKKISSSKEFIYKLMYNNRGYTFDEISIQYHSFVNWYVFLTEQYDGEKKDFKECAEELGLMDYIDNKLLGQS